MDVWFLQVGGGWIRCTITDDGDGQLSIEHSADGML
jgi:hypothetical protein